MRAFNLPNLPRKPRFTLEPRVFVEFRRKTKKPFPCDGEKEPCHASSAYLLPLFAGLFIPWSFRCVGRSCAGSAQAADKIEYNRDVRPILAENCFPCHGPDSAARKASLAAPKEAIDAGALVPNKPEESELLSRIESEDAETRMPPAKLNKKLTPGLRKNYFATGLLLGAEYQPHWSLIAPVRPALPDGEKRSLGSHPDRSVYSGQLEQPGSPPARRPIATPWPAG